MRTIVVACLIAAFCAAPGVAQTRRVYLSALAGTDVGARGSIGNSALARAGGSIGFRLSKGWSVEAELERGFYSDERTDEGLWLSRVGPGASREEIERNGIHARFDRTERAGLGWSVAALWNSRGPGRLNAALFAGIGSRRFTMRTIRTVTSIGPGVDPSPTNPDLQTVDETRSIAGGGATGGLRVLVRLTPDLTVGPEFRYTLGVITDDRSYSVVRVSGRITWGF